MRPRQHSATRNYLIERSLEFRPGLQIPVPLADQPGRSDHGRANRPAAALTLQRV